MVIYINLQNLFIAVPTSIVITNSNLMKYYIQLKTIKFQTDEFTFSMERREVLGGYFQK